jgi:murein DD-endopeptidase MepM/ murein hydrolase activator NlpD
VNKFVLSFLYIIFFLTGFTFAQVKYAVIPEDPLPGEPVSVSTIFFARQASLLVDGKQLTRALFVSVPAENNRPGFITAIMTIPTTANPGPAIIRLESERGIIYEIPIIISDREFQSETISLNQSLTRLLTDPNPQRIEEANQLQEILRTTGSRYYHTDSFILPIDSTRRTSIFGNRRVYRYSTGRTTTSIHAGVDFGAPTGTEVYACGSGKVILARMRIVSGNSVIIEHAPGVYSLYYHLSKIEVQENTMVNTGDLIGLVGSTGLSTGPHLHWEVRISGENTDPDILIERSILDKTKILSKIYY